MSDEEFRDGISENLLCRIVLPGKDCSVLMDDFLSKCTYFQIRGTDGYSNQKEYRRLDDHLEDHVEDEHDKASRIFYFAVPPQIFQDAAKQIALRTAAKKGQTRIIIEKPFGISLASARELLYSVQDFLEEDEVYRIDHYLGKEMVQNLLVMRFGNAVFEPLWNRFHIDSVEITFRENFGVENRGAYFDKYGIIRDIMQNHLLQVLSLIAMEPPISLHSNDISQEKVKLLRCIERLKPSDFVLGQYEGFRDEVDVDPSSRTPTFAACVFRIKNRRWDGVPFIMKAGKMLNDRSAEVRLRFKETPGMLFDDAETEWYGTKTSRPRNELIIRLQGNEGIFMKIATKVPGFDNIVDFETVLKLSYRQDFGDRGVDMPEAYERLLLDAMNGERTLFVTNEELLYGWKIFDEALQAMGSQSGAHREDDLPILHRL